MLLTEVLLSSGRSIRLDEVKMSPTYGGMLEGYPCRRVNDWSVENLRGALTRYYPSIPAHLVVAWYQPGPELTDPAGAVPGLAELPWDELAEDCEY